MTTPQDSWGGELIRDRLWFDDGFTTIPNAWARDPHITHQARGLLVQIASHKAGFRITLSSLVAGALNGREAIRSMLDELQRGGYLLRTTYREGNLKRYRYRLRDPHAPAGVDGQAAFNLEQEAPPRKPRSAQVTGFPSTGIPTTGNRPTENPTRIERLTNNKSTTALEVTTEQAQCHRGHQLLPGLSTCGLGHYTQEREAQRLAEIEQEREAR